MNSDQIASQPSKIDSAPRISHVVLIWFVSSIILFLCLRPNFNKPLQWDEVDYIQAARQGFINNATDSTAIAPLDLIELIISKLKNTKVQVKPSYVESNDVFMLRHTHPPFLQYALILIGRDQLNPGHEWVQRFVQFAAGTVMIATMLWGYQKLAGRNSSDSGLVTTAAAGLLCGSFVSGELNCHLWIAISLVPTCLSLGQFISNPSRKNGVITGCWIGINFLGLQTGVFVAFWSVIAIGISILLKTGSEDLLVNGQLKYKMLDWIKRSCWMLIGFLFIILITYPAALTRLSLLRIFALYAFVIMKGSEYASVSTNYNRYLALTFPILIIAFIGLIQTLIHIKHKRSNHHTAFAVVGFGYGLVLLKFLLNITYITPSLAILAVLGSASLSAFHKRTIETIVCLLFVISTGYIIYSKPDHLDYGTLEGYSNLKALVEKTDAFVEGGTILQYYIPDRFDKFLPITTGDGGQSLIRRDTSTLQYLTITPEELAGKIVILGSFNGHSIYEWERNLPASVKRLQVPGMGGRIYQFPDAPIIPDPKN